jgi:hypothetical protein
MHSTGRRRETGAALDALLADGTCGEASTGIRLREEPAPTTPAT